MQRGNRLQSLLARPQLALAAHPPLRLGVLVSVITVVVATAAIYPLKHLAPAVALSVVYLPAVLLVSVYWGLALGLVTSLASAAAFNFFHIPPVGRFTISDSRNWVALAAFTTIAAVVSTIAESARSRAIEAERRSAEADLAAALARELLAGAGTRAALQAVAHRVAQALGLRSATLELGEVPGSERQTAIPLLGTDGGRLATLLVPADLSAENTARLRMHVIPSLQALIAVALHRDAAQAEAVTAAALRRSDELKTALLQAVSHDLRTPVTAIHTAGHALGTRSLTDDERAQLSLAIVEESDRLSSLIDNLLDLSRLQAGRAEPHRDWVSIEEVLLAARDALPPARGEIQLSVDPAAPAIRADPVQLERAFANLIENAHRYSHGLPVLVRARAVGSRLIVRVVDRGPGIAAHEQELIFEPFYRGAARGSSAAGSGLGLAIAKGFIEANGGTITVESLPGQGTSFVVAFALGDRAKVAA